MLKKVLKFVEIAMEVVITVQDQILATAKIALKDNFKILIMEMHA